MSTESTTSTRLAVIGAGPGGYAAAFLASDLGLDVTLIDPKPNPGGVCLFHGCIPSKALLHVVKVIEEARQASRWGVEFSDPKIDLEKLRSWKDSVVGKLTGGLGEVTKRRRVRYLQGHARFRGGNGLDVQFIDGGEQRIQFEHAIVAAGSRPAGLPNVPGDSSRFLDSTSALELKDVSGRLLVVGGGYIGLELGAVYATLGSRITVVEMTSNLLPGVDEDLVRPLEKRLSGLFEDILVNTKVANFNDQHDRVRVVFEGKGIENPEQEFDRVLVSVGRKPNSQGLGLENTRVEVDAAGFVRVDNQLRTSDPSIFAIGDLVGQPMLAHKASHEGRIAAEVIAGRSAVFEPRAIPAVVFTDPEIAWCGLTEIRAKKAGRNVRVVRFPWAASGRATTMDRTEGLTKMLIDPETERVLGVGIAGSGAGELISEGVLAMEMAAEATDVKLTIHPHPTLSETFMESAALFFGESSHVYRPRKDLAARTSGPKEGGAG